MWHLPIHWMCGAMGFKIGEIFNSVKEAIIPSGGGKEGKHVSRSGHVQPRMREIPMKHNGVKVWAEFKYEKCLDFYYKCGIIGYGDKTCNSEEKTGTTLRNG